MDINIEKIKSLVEGAEKMYETYDLNSVDSVGMVDLTAHDAELALSIARKADHNIHNIDVIDSLILRMKILRAKIETVKAQL